jgi:hypothetical protein
MGIEVASEGGRSFPSTVRSVVLAAQCVVQPLRPSKQTA